MGTDLVVGPLSILAVEPDHQKDQVGIQVVVKGIPTVTKVEADSAVSPQFILQADEELSQLPDLETVISNDMMQDMAYENDIMAAKMSADAEGNSGDLVLPMEVAKMPLQGSASEKQFSQENLLTIAARILMLVLLKHIS
ncbi:UNVERIFIED_CONTAM: hypothetical protein K2H54_046227 [Gekko kuhli]